MSATKRSSFFILFFALCNSAFAASDPPHSTPRHFTLPPRMAATPPPPSPVERCKDALTTSGITDPNDIPTGRPAPRTAAEIELTQVRLSQPLIPQEFLPRVPSLLVEGTLMNEHYAGVMKSTAYRQPPAHLSPREQILWVAAQQGLVIELGEELFAKDGTPKGAMKRTFRMRVKEIGGTWVEGFAKIYDRALIAEATGKTINDVTDEYIARLIQRDNFILAVAREAAERFNAGGSATLSIRIPRSFGSELLTSYGIELQAISPGRALKSSLAMRGIRLRKLMNEYIEYHLFVDRLESDLKEMLRPHIENGLYIIVMAGSVDDSSPYRITDLSGDRNTNVDFIDHDNDTSSAIFGVFDP